MADRLSERLRGMSEFNRREAVDARSIHEPAEITVAEMDQVADICEEAAAELDRRDELALRYEAWVRAMHGPTSVPPVVDRSIEEAEQALLALSPVED